MAEPLSDRARDVLHAIIREYIVTGGPVGSQQLARTSSFEVSSATLRNVMADLEELGYLEKPHTSAGRVPTGPGVPLLRRHPDSPARPEPPRPRAHPARHPHQRGPLEESLQEAGRILHFLTRHAGVVVTPRPTSGTFHRIEFVRLREDRVLAILVDQDGQVHNRPVSAGLRDVPGGAGPGLQLPQRAAGEAPPRAGPGTASSRSWPRTRRAYDQLVGEGAEARARSPPASPPTEKVFIEGTGSFLDAPEFADVERMKSLFRALEEKTRLMALLDRVQRAREMQIFIGHESDLSPGGDVSLVATPYGPADRSLGTVGVIGPTRMNYQRVIPLVQFTAQVLSSALES